MDCIDYNTDRTQVSIFGNPTTYSEKSLTNFRGRKLNFYRKENNFGYVIGDVIFDEECDNLVVISDKKQTRLSNAKNCLVVISSDSVSVSPIQDIKRTMQAREILERGRIIYHIPQSVRTREELDKKSIREIGERVEVIYGICPIEVRELSVTSKKNGIYYIRDSSGKEYILKYEGVIPKDHIYKVTNSIPDIFPIRKPTKDGNFSFRLSDGFYGLEEFVKASAISCRNEQYFVTIGSAMASMHQRLNDFLNKHPELKKYFVSVAKHISESNMVSLLIDLELAGYTRLVEEIEKLRRHRLDEEIKLFPDCFIHGDLNSSNVVWTEKGLRFIDVESMKISKRVLDLESPIIFQGNMHPPNYIPGSLDALIKGYNTTTKEPFQKKEIEVGGLLIKYALLKNFVIRHIRRGEEGNSLENLLENLEKLEADTDGK